MSGFTPMMEQYFEIKKNHKNSLLFFRLGDFYELFFTDAEIASRELEITLTGKDCGQKERAPMCGVPHHSAEGYISKLVEKGYEVAICEQTEDPKFAKKIVKREVVRVVTPGTLLDSNVLKDGKNNYIMCLNMDKKGFGIAVADVSTGEFLTTEIKKDSSVSILDEIARYCPSEIICNLMPDESSKLYSLFHLRPKLYNQWAFNYETAHKKLCTHFKILNLNVFGIEGDILATGASGALLDYLSDTQKNELCHLSAIRKYTNDKYMTLDLSSRRNLELTQTMLNKTKKGSLLWVLDKTKTAMGKRLLRSWVEQPLLSIDEINKRLDGVEQMKNSVFIREDLKELLNTIYDIERLLSKIVYQSANARDLTAFKNSLLNLPAIKNIINELNCTYINELYESFDTLTDLFSLIDEAIADEPPVTVREGDIIKTGYNETVDQLRFAKNEGSAWILKLESEEKEKTGIKNLKIRYNKVFGYYIEITNSYKDSVPEEYVRKQTLSNCERYITPQLKEIEETILTASEKISSIEYEIFNNVRQSISEHAGRIRQTTRIIATIDTLQSLGEVADKQNYVKPEVNNGFEIDIRNGRHPVIEKTLTEPFIPNDIYLDNKNDRLLIVTGPNMAGKSTYMRQTALLVLLAQMGSYIPADSGTIGVTDRIFTRVGASDDLATGQSTFMVEMSEVANILNYATPKSLLILDEIGRGTSTFDGLSIAWAIVEYIADKEIVGARTLFATHYHELTELEGKVIGVKNYRVSISEQNGDIIFLHKIERGGADESYGIHVAKLAGVPLAVIDRSKQLLSVLNETGIKKRENIVEDEIVYYTPQKKRPRPDFFVELESIDLNSLSPINAWQIIYDWKESANKDANSHMTGEKNE